MKKNSRIALTILLGLATVVGCRLPDWTASAQTATWKPKPKRGDAVKALVVTGGHDYDPEFYSAFDDEGIKAKVDPHPLAFTSDFRNRADVLVLYDTAQDLDERRQKNLRDFVESGRGVVVVHHGICSNVNWPWWYEEVVGGRWLFQPVDGKKSGFKHDEEITVRPAMQHPITREISEFRIWDETYKDLWISPKVKVLLRTDNPTSDGPVAWIGPSEKSRVVYLQLGHDRNANLNPIWQKLVRNAIFWAAGKLN
jgi:type 1 glutamine amidotransferase